MRATKTYYPPLGRGGYILIILLLALGLRVAAATKWHRDTVADGKLLRLGDSDSYWVLAGHLARGEPYEYGSPDARIFRAPVYPLVLAPFTLIPDMSTGIYCARIMGCLLGTCAVYLVMKLASRLYLAANPADTNSQAWRFEVMAGLLAAVYPGAIGMSIVILSEAIFCPLMLLTLLGWQRGLTSPNVKNPAKALFGAGMACGLAILARPSWLLFMPLAGMAVLTVSRRRLHHLLVLMVMAAGCVSVMAPWWYRNWLITDRFVPTTLQVGASLYDGWHAGATGASDEDMQFVNEYMAQQRARDQELNISGDNSAETLSRYSNFEYRLNASMQQAAVDWARKNISGVIRLALVKFARTWNVWPEAGQVGSSGLKAVLTFACFGVVGLAALASWRLLGGAKENFALVAWSVALCWGPAVYFTLLHMVFVGSIRYREPAVLILSALASLALTGNVTGGGRARCVAECPVDAPRRP